MSTTTSVAHPIRSERAPVRQIVIAAVVTFVLLTLTVTVVADQSPILPLELGVVMFGLLSWVVGRRSRAAFVTITVFAGLLFALAVKVLVGDIVEGEATLQLFTDIPLVPAVGALFWFGLKGSRHPR
jgi:hypothetical protein